RYAAASADGLAAARGRMRIIAFRSSMGEMKKPEAIKELEILSVTWRGDETETATLQMLAHLYTEENRFRDAFRAMRTALAVQPDSEITRRIQEEAIDTFDRLFLGGRADKMPAIDALSLFFDYRELTPIGRRGDEMIRRLAERLVGVDLLD